MTRQIVALSGTRYDLVSFTNHIRTPSINRTEVQTGVALVAARRQLTAEKQSPSLEPRSRFELRCTQSNATSEAT
jgi:hypothetical protein